ncbi:MAG: DUF4202 domain-containing protein [Verrucomicrobia bacterium]|nr:DUF4202 domain-containing protein [Verrucomicrobiota bacterium]
MATEPSDPQRQGSARFDAALRRFDEENGRDPNREVVAGVSQPRELLYARRLTDWVRALCPAASEVLLLAARCQHLCRWMIPRGDYPLTRAGYLKWRTDLKHFHAQKAGEILCQVGYSEDIVARVQALNLKKNFPDDPESRVLEDALCLVFLQFQFAELANKTAEDKMISAIQKVWKKMTRQAQTLALQLSYGEREKKLLDSALASD